jgi:hypothetical protein
MVRVETMTDTERNQLERACERARLAGLMVVGHGTRKVDGAAIYAVPSMRNPQRWHLVAVVGGQLACDCVAGSYGKVCVHRATVHAFLAAGLLAARKAAEKTTQARQTAPRPRTDTAAFSVFK